MHSMPILLGILAVMAVAYRFYSAFLASKVAALDPSRITPAHELKDGQNYHPTNRWILFGHHFAAISGAGPLIGPVLAIQFGYMPGLIWLVIGVCLAGAVQDFLVLAASVRHRGQSLANIAKTLLGPKLGVLTSVSILFIVIIALSGLGVVVVKALGGERVGLYAGSTIQAPEAMAPQAGSSGPVTYRVPAGSRVLYPNGTEFARSEAFVIEVPEADSHPTTSNLKVPEKSFELIRGSSWGTFTIACTIPIALFVGWYMYRFRKGRVIEASLLGAAAVVVAAMLTVIVAFATAAGIPAGAGMGVCPNVRTRRRR